MEQEASMQRDIRRTKAVGWLIIVVFGLALVLLLGSVGVLSWQYEKAHRFDSAAWMTGTPSTHTEMLDDLLSQYPLVGLSRAETMALLGGGSKYNPYASDDTLVYTLEQDDWSVSYLVLTLENDVVTQVEQLPT